MSMVRYDMVPGEGGFSAPIELIGTIFRELRELEKRVKVLEENLK